jgi:predicted aconitase
MFLTREEESILAGEQGPGRQRALELLVAIGKIYSAQHLISISSAHLSGISYKTIGDGGLDFLTEMAKDAKASVKTTINPAGMDLESWREMGVSEEFAHRQLQIIDRYRNMGMETTCTCTPYLHQNVPHMGDHVAWAESNALSYVNSIIGARTNREGGPGALSAAILGKTPFYGLHLKENRAPTVIVEADIHDDIFSHSMLGQTVGRELGNVVPYFRGVSGHPDKLKIMAAAMAASGSVAMFHVEGISPEAEEFELDGLESVFLDQEEVLEAQRSLTDGSDPELIALGCPHLSPGEVGEIASLLKGKRKKADIDVWFCTNRWVASRCPDEIRLLKEFGTVAYDTCMVVAPIEEHYRCTATNSAKACNYLPGLCSQKVVCDSAPHLLELLL